MCRAALVSARRRDCARQRLNRISILCDSQKHTTRLLGIHISPCLSLFSSLSQLFHNSLSFFLSFSLPVRCARGWGLTFTFARVLVSSTCRWARLATHRHKVPHQMCIPCSRVHLGRVPTACVSSPKRLGSLHRLAHAAGHGHFLSASTSRRSDPCV